MTTPIKLTAGDCLIAPPTCRDPRFKKSVIYLWEHSEEGSAGVVINRPSNHCVGEIIDTVPENIGDRIMHWGGPVHTHVVFMLHTLDWQTHRSNIINSSMGVTSDIKMFDYMSAEQPDAWNVFFGHASWGPGQLEGELKGEGPWDPSHSWLILKNPDTEWLFDTATELMWDTAVEACSRQAIDSWI